MIAAMMTYIFAVSFLLTLAGAAAERVAAALRLPRRWGWAAAMVASFALPCAALLAANSRAQSFGFIDADASYAAAAPDHALRTLVAFPPPLGWPIWNEFNAALVILWVLTSAGMFALVVALSLRLHRKLRHGPVHHVNGDLVSVTEDMGPAIFGAFRPRILMPRWIESARADVREAALRHEQAHIAGRDPLLYACALLLVALAPWNLPLWLQLRRLRFAIEVDCDARVLRSGLDSATYGEALLAVAERKSSTPFAAMALIEQASHLERRIELMLLGKNRTYVFAGLAMVLLAAAPVAYALVLDPPVAQMSGKAARAIIATPVTVAAVPDRPVVKAAEQAVPVGNAALNPPVAKVADEAKAVGEAAPVAAALDPAVANASEPRFVGDAGTISIKVRSAPYREDNRIVFSGNVRVGFARGLFYSADQLTKQMDDSLLLQGNVQLKAGSLQVFTDRAVVTPSADGSASISVDQGAWVGLPFLEALMFPR